MQWRASRCAVTSPTVGGIGDAGVQIRVTRKELRSETQSVHRPLVLEKGENEENRNLSQAWTTGPLQSWCHSEEQPAPLLSRCSVVGKDPTSLCEQSRNGV
jgi:hypothetical protein